MRRSKAGKQQHCTLNSGLTNTELSSELFKKFSTLMFQCSFPTLTIITNILNKSQQQHSILKFQYNKESIVSFLLKLPFCSKNG